MLIIIGTKDKFEKKNTSEKTCPFCGLNYDIIEKKRFLTVFFIPVFSVKKNSFLQCPNCNRITQ